MNAVSKGRHNPFWLTPSYRLIVPICFDIFSGHSNGMAGQGLSQPCVKSWECDSGLLTWFHAEQILSNPLTGFEKITELAEKGKGTDRQYTLALT